MSEFVINSPQTVREWFVRSGVAEPLKACIGELPSTGAYVAHWTRHSIDTQPRDIAPHPGFLRIAVMLEPLESRVWKDEQPVWGGTIAAHHFRICGPQDRGRWSQLSRCDIANVFLPVTTVRRYAAMAGLPPDRAPVAPAFVADRRVAELVTQMLDAVAFGGDLSLHYCDGLVTALLAYLLAHYAPADTTPELDDDVIGVPSAASAPGTNALRGQPLRRVLAHIRERSGDDVYVTELAALCGMSESHFAREFKRAVGMPPHQYLLKHRLEEARLALRHTDERIGEIALNLGFTDTSHFSRLFSTRFGLTPTRFRRLHRGVELGAAVGAD